MSNMRVWIVGLALCGLVAMGCGSETETETRSKPSVESERSAPAQQTPGVLIVNYATDSADTFPAPRGDSMTALKWIEIYANSRGLNMATRHFPFGDLLVQLGPRRSGDNGNWFYKVNGLMATQAVSKQRVAPTDTVVVTFK